MKNYLWMSSAAVVIDTLRVKNLSTIIFLFNKVAIIGLNPAFGN